MATTPVLISDYKDSNGAWYQGGAQAYYAAKQFQATEDNNFWRNLIAAGQAATQIYFADKQHTIAVRQNEIATQQQNRLDNISNIELARSGQVYDQWVKGINCEDDQLLEACGMLAEKPDINDIRRMVSADAKRAFGAVKKQLRENYAPSCADAMCSALNRVANEEARAIVAVTTSTYLKQTQIYEIRQATIRSWRYQVLAFGRGSIQASTALMQGAAQASNAASQVKQVNPYSGYIQAINGMATTAQGVLSRPTGMGTNMRDQFVLPSGSTNIDYRNQMDIDSDNYSNLNSLNSFDRGEQVNGQSPTAFPSSGAVDGEPIMNSTNWDMLGMGNNT